MTAEVDAQHLAEPAVPLGDLVAGQLPATVPYSPST